MNLGNHSLNQGVTLQNNIITQEQAAGTMVNEIQDHKNEHANPNVNEHSNPSLKNHINNVINSLEGQEQSAILERRSNYYVYIIFFIIGFIVLLITLSNLTSSESTTAGNIISIIIIVVFVIYLAYFIKKMIDNNWNGWSSSYENDGIILKIKYV